MAANDPISGTLPAGPGGTPDTAANTAGENVNAASAALSPLDKFDPFKWLEIEYQRAAERYENIYKMYWQSFAYLSVISGAILTFGGSHFNEGFTLCFACMPILFWYYASCVPLDRYAGQVEQRLREIETIVQRLIATKPVAAVANPPSAWPAMFTEFGKREDSPPTLQVLGEMSKTLFQFQRPARPRVRKTMDFAFLIVRCLAVAFLVVGLWQQLQSGRPAPASPAVTIDVGTNLAEVLKDAVQRLGR